MGSVAFRQAQRREAGRLGFEVRFFEVRFFEATFLEVAFFEVRFFEVAFFEVLRLEARSALREAASAS